MHGRDCQASTIVAHGLAPISGVVAAAMVVAAPVPSRASGRVHSFSFADAIRFRRPSHRSRGCAELPLMVQTSPIAGFLIPVAASGKSLAADCRHR
ncbi:MAG: hypothetical protein QOE09_1523 [Ilumatobacteraceae bacterium]